MRARPHLAEWLWATLTAGFVLWSLGVWYAKYVHCDDLLRDLGTRQVDGEMLRCTPPSSEMTFEFEGFWLIGALTYLLGSVALMGMRNRLVRNRYGSSGGAVPRFAGDQDSVDVNV